MPTRAARVCFVAASTLVALGLGTMSAGLVALGGTALVGLGFALAATMPLGRRVRAQRLEFAWWLGHGEPDAAGGAVTPGAPFTVKCYVRHRGDAPLRLAHLQPLLPEAAGMTGARVVDEPENADDGGLEVAPHARTEFSFRLVASAAGRVVLHGLAVRLRGPLSLFEVPLYFPNPLAVKVLPSAAAMQRGTARTVTGLPLERTGTTRLRRPGGGTELRELREMLPGDPFKSIAWRPSARAGKLLVREVEREVQETRMLVVDVSGTMRGGPPGQRKLDYAIEAAAAEARRALAAGDRVGVLTVDGRVLAYVSPGEGAPHAVRVYDALLSATEVVDADLTEVDDDEVVAIVGRYVRHQDGLDFSVPGRASGWDVGALVAHVGRALEAEAAKGGASRVRGNGGSGIGAAHEPRGGALTGPRGEVQAPTPTGALLRRFCRARGLPLPYRPDPRDGSKAAGLGAALREAAGGTRQPRTLVTLTDFDGLGDPAPLVAAVELLRSHGHVVVFVALDARAFATPPRSELEARLWTVYGRGEERRLREARAMLGRLGAPVIVPRVGEPAAAVIERARASRRAA
jgi:uncharacterized protein (DUF58 family)